MSIKIVSRVWDARNLNTPAFRLVLLKLADCANDAGERSFPSVQTIADDCELSGRQVQRALRWLTDHGFIAQVSASSHHRPAEWAVCLDAAGKPYARTERAPAETDEGRHPVTPAAAEQGRHLRPSGVTSATGRGDISDLPDSVPNRTVQDPSVPVPAGQALAHVRRALAPVSSLAKLDAEFEAFWQAYPRRVGKRAAQQVWLRLRPTAALQARILAAVAQQRTCEQWLKDGGQYIPHPQTWLRQGRWDDEPVQVPQMNESTTKTLSAGARWLAKQKEAAQ